MMLDNVQALPVGTRLGDYRLDAVIGQGGFGITYRAFDSQLAKVVAIKEYLPAEFAVRDAKGRVVPRGSRFADDFSWGRDRFLEEARALARFRHPHIVPVLRFLAANGTVYTVMEFEDGRSVAELLREPGRRMPPDEVVRLTEGLLSGLKAVHEQGFLHRDIKPSNVIVRLDGVPVLIDFGAARQAVGRTQTLTSVLTPQYAPIEQYAVDGKQGPWTDIYSAAALLHRAIAGEPPPEAASRVGQDPYRPLARTQADRFDQTFLAAIDRALAFAPQDRPQSIERWRALFGNSLPTVALTSADLPTQRLPAVEPQPPSVLRLEGVSRGDRDVSRASPPVHRRGRRVAVASVGVVAIAALCVAAWQFQPQIKALLVQIAAIPTPTAPAPLPEAPTPPAAQTQAPPPPPRVVDQSAMIAQAQRAAAEARAAFEQFKEAASAAISLAGEARIVAARAAAPGLENAQRVTTDDGASYVGQVADGKRQGLGVIEAKDGTRRVGEWKDDLLSGLGTERQPDGLRFEGQWRDDHPSGLGVLERPGVERLEGNFSFGRLDGRGVRRSFADPSVVQFGEWRAGALDGPGVEIVGDKERYEGGFRAGKRHGYGQVVGPDEKVQSGRWEDGKRVETNP